MKMCYIGLFIGVVSFMGYLLENLWLAVTKGYIDNRNMTLPFLLGYGLLVTAFWLCFGTPENISFFGFKTDITGALSWFIYLCIAFIVICVGEHILGTLVEKICGVEYWNYDWLPFKISKYTTFPTSVGFSLILTLFMGYAARPLAAFFTRIEETTATRFGIIITLVLLLDFAASFNYMHKKKKLNEKWRINLRRTAD